MHYFDHQGKFENNRSFEMIGQIEYFGIIVTGHFVASSHRGTNLSFSGDGFSYAYLNMNAYTGGWAAHELFIHALAYYRGWSDWGHGNPLLPNYGRDGLYYKKAMKK